MFIMEINSHGERKAYSSTKEPGYVSISISFHTIDGLISFHTCYFPICLVY
jgi:hypothetical protein